MTQDFDLTPMAKAIGATLPEGYTFVLIVVEERTIAEAVMGKPAHSQFVSPMAPMLAHRTMKSFLAAAEQNPIFNPK
jgi:hypothetical protein